MTSASIKDRLHRGPVTKTVRMWLGADMDLVEQYETAARELNQSPGAKRLSGEGSKAEITARMTRLREQLEEYAVDFRLRGLGAKAFERLTAAHPTRQLPDGQPDPRDRLGWNAETFPSALIREATMSPDLDEEDWTVLLGDDDTDGQLTAGQVDELAAAAFTLSKHPVDVPFWRDGSPSPPSSENE